MKKDSVNSKNVVGTRLRQARERLSPTVPTEELSARLLARGVTLRGPAIGHIEEGPRRVRGYELLALAACLNISVAWLIGEIEDADAGSQVVADRR